MVRFEHAEELTKQNESVCMPNRLAEASSPYLRQHADNPVDWYPWDEEALREARDSATDLAVDWLCCLPLVPRDGARVL